MSDMIEPGIPVYKAEYYHGDKAVTKRWHEEVINHGINYEN